MESKLKNPNKLLVLCQLFYPELVSTGQTLTELCEMLVDMGVDIEVVCGPPTYVDRKSLIPNNIEYHGIRIRRAWGTRFPKLNIIGRTINQVTFAISAFLRLASDSSKMPMLVLTNPPFLAMIGSIFRIFRGRRYVYLIFDVYPETPIRLGILKEKGLVSRLWERCNSFMLRHASVIIVIGRCMRDIMVKKVDSETKGKISVIHVWSDDKLIQEVSDNKNPFRQKWGLEGKFVVSYSGNMGRFHDMETIIESVKILNKKFNDIAFLFIGEGHKKAKIQELARVWRLKNCQFHTYVERKDFGLSLQCADIGLVSLLEGQEGLSVPSKAFGLMAAGLPVIGVMSNKSEVARIIVEEQCGVVIKPGDAEGLVKAILDLYNDKSKLSIMGRNARNAIDSKYNLKAAAKAYYKIITTVNKIDFQEGVK